ncbi:response regulator transcription factor [Roseomonas stagni]|uniref:Response regulator transcription factor n=1 Tax=Falsiroseomonas algicola TaxID=2716930 RepID=A0A6M1LW16_9PROT|nr:response regulator transcription factor [Falsiroseomonas algicola]NGM24172.1 response regulator transcription factor [Falsiroseomonas algicola]
MEPLIHILEDDASLRDALVRFFRSTGLDAVAYASVASFLEERDVNRPGCLILDVRLPDMDGLDLHAQFNGLGITLPTIVVTGHGDIPMSVRAMKAGAVDFLAKPFRDADILAAVEVALERDRERRASNGEVMDVQSRYATLSPREKEVGGLIVRGLMNKQVAWELGLSEITVKIHRRAVMQKMGTKSLADLVRLMERLRRL